MVNDYQEYIETMGSIKRLESKPKLLLHVCCAPCSTSVLEKLRELFDVTLFFYNPNIFPKSEYSLRSEAVEKYVKGRGYKENVIVAPFDPKEFNQITRIHSEEREGGPRCKRCFAIRLRESAKKAKARGYEYFSTSISVSPHKNSKWINELGRHFEKIYGVKFLVADFKKQNGFRECVELSKEYNVYRQDYCGCLYSKLERIVLPSEVEYVLEKLNLKGTGYVVGGSVRDLLLNISPRDYDFATTLSSAEICEIFEAYHPIIVGKSFEIVQIKMGDYLFDIARYRKEWGILDGRHPKNIEFVSDIVEDLSRRDFTMNAFAYNLKEGLVDPYQGVSALLEGKIVAVGEPKLRFQEDYLRILRGLRHATELKFEIEENTLEAMKVLKEGIATLSSERVAIEFFKILLSNNVRRGLELLCESGVLSIIIPEFNACIGFNQRAKHQCYELHEHIFAVVEHTPVHLPLRLSALLHDISKPHCQVMREDGFAKYSGHAELSAKMSEVIFARLKVSNVVAKESMEYIRYHSSWRAYQRVDIKRAISELSLEKYRNLLHLFRADVYGKSKPHCFKLFCEIEDMIEDILMKKEPITLFDLALTGSDLVETYQGKEIGEALQACVEYVWKNPKMNEKKLLLGHLKILKG